MQLFHWSWCWGTRSGDVQLQDLGTGNATSIFDLGCCDIDMFRLEDIRMYGHFRRRELECSIGESMSKEKDKKMLQYPREIAYPNGNRTSRSVLS